jgi:dipeptidyl aminopeptidase/acylaminoacyl peptidase
LAALIMALPAYGAFSGANGKIAFHTMRPSSGFADIYSINPDGTGLSKLTDLQGDEFGPAWSAAGTRILFSAETFGQNGIWVMSADGSGLSQLVVGEGPSSPTWSPDGGQIAYQCCGAVPPKIWLANSDGTNQRTFKPCCNSDWELRPDWSPDGSKLAMVREPQGGEFNLDIWVADFSGGIVRLTTDPQDDDHPSWSPDGSKIAFDRAGDIWAMNADGSDQVNLTPGSIGGESPAWSPDGTKIAFQTFGGTSLDIAVVNADGSGFQLITDDAFNDLSPDWQPLHNEPPDCSGVEASPSVFDRVLRTRFVSVRLEGAADPDGDAVSIAIDGVTQDEPVTGPGDPTHPDAGEGLRPGEVRLRSERAPRGDGRVYRIAFTATDSGGGSCTGTATVSVPRHKRREAVDTAPPSYDSFER